MKLDKMDKVLIEMTDTDKYNLYRCEEHGMFAIRKDKDTKLCSYCKKEGTPYEQ